MQVCLSSFLAPTELKIKLSIFLELNMRKMVCFMLKLRTHTKMIFNWHHGKNVITWCLYLYIREKDQTIIDSQIPSQIKLSFYERFLWDISSNLKTSINYKIKWPRPPFSIFQYKIELRRRIDEDNLALPWSRPR